MKRFSRKHQELAYYSSPVYLQAIILFLLSVVLYINTIGFDYTLDDTMIITDNRFTTQGISGMYDILTTDAMAGYLDNPEELLSGGRYRPLSMLMFALEYHLWGHNPFPGHLINIVLYAFLVVLIFFLLRLMFKFQYQKPWYLTLPFIAAAIFAVHPLHTEAVANIKGRDEIMAMLGAAGTLWLLIRYVDLRDNFYLLYAGVVFFLALMSKENAVTMLAVVPLMIWCFRNEKLRTYIIVMLPLMAGLAIYLLFRYNALGFWTNVPESMALLNDPFLEATAEQKYATIFYTWGVYLKLLFYPHPLTHDYYPYHISLMSFSDPVVWLSLGVWFILGAYAVVRIWKRDVIAFGILFFLITFSVSSNLFFSVGTFMNERFVFMPLLGFAVIAGWFFNQTLRRAFRSRYVYKRVTLFILVLVVLAASARTVVRNLAWKDDLTLFTTDVKISSNSTKVNTSAGGKLREAAAKEPDPVKKDSMLRLSETYLKRALEIHPKNFQSAILLGQNYLDRKMYGEAITTYDYILHRRPEHTKALNNMHYVLQRARVEGDYMYAIEAGTLLKEWKPGDAAIYTDLAVAWLDAENPDSAIHYLQKAIRVSPRYASAWQQLGRIYGKYLNDLETAEHYLARALEINPESYLAADNLGIVYAQQGKFEQAEKYLKKAIQINPESETSYYNMIQVMKDMGKPHKAKEYQQKLLEIKRAKKL